MSDIFVFDNHLLAVTFMDSFNGLEFLAQKLLRLVEVVPELHSHFHRLLKKHIDPFHTLLLFFNILSIFFVLCFS